jgi:hypothetical protein
MFQRCGFSGADWIDLPTMFMYTTQLMAGQFLAGEKQSVGSSAGADFYLRRLQLVNASLAGTPPLPQVYTRILCPNGHYLQSGNPANASFAGPGTAVPAAGTLTPGPLGLVKPEVHCPAGSSFTIDLLNVTPIWNTPGESITVSIVFEGVYRFRLNKAC